MANPDQKTILFEQVKRDVREICNKYKDESGATDSEIKSLLIELSYIWGKI